MTSPADVLQMVKDNDVKFIDYRLTDTRGKEQHLHRTDCTKSDP